MPVGPLDDGARGIFRRVHGAVARAVHDEEIGDATIAERGDDLLGDGACADDKRGVAGEFAEDAFGKFDSGGGDGHGTHAELRFGANALADFERALEKAISTGPVAPCSWADL